VQAKAAPAPAKQQSTDIFIVHGHDEAARHEVARFIEQLGLHPIILHEKPDRGKTIIEKFEHHADVGFAVVLLTPDDVGHPKDKPAESKPRPRQNVVLELGYFIGKLRRSSVCALLKGDIEIPSDYAGVLYTRMDDAGAWKVTLAREIKAAGIDADLNKLT
jgi:predicted nucleotide-binding protein